MYTATEKILQLQLFLILLFFRIPDFFIFFNFHTCFFFCLFLLCITIHCIFILRSLSKSILQLALSDWHTFVLFCVAKIVLHCQLQPEIWLCKHTCHIYIIDTTSKADYYQTKRQPLVVSPQNHTLSNICLSSLLFLYHIPGKSGGSFWMIAVTFVQSTLGKEMLKRNWPPKTKWILHRQASRGWPIYSESWLILWHPCLYWKQDEAKISRSITSRVNIY